jgi:ribosomal protein S16
MEVLGTYDPTPHVPLATNAPETIDEVTGLPRKPKKYKDIQLDQSRTKYWLGVGAQPSEPVERLLCLVRMSTSILISGRFLLSCADGNAIDWTGGAETVEDDENESCASNIRSQRIEGSSRVVTMSVHYMRCGSGEAVVHYMKYGRREAVACCIARESGI